MVPKAIAALVPRTTTPLTKFVRTLEGWLVIAANGVLVIVPLAGSLPWGTSVKYMAILNVGTVISRSVLKGIASLSPVTGAPIEPAGLPASLESLDWEQGPALDELGPDPEATAVLSEPGTPADQLRFAGEPSLVENPTAPFDREQHVPGDER